MRECLSSAWRPRRLERGVLMGGGRGRGDEGVFWSRRERRSPASLRRREANELEERVAELEAEVVEGEATAEGMGCSIILRRMRWKERASGASM